MQGWIKLHRQLSENPLWLMKPFSEGQAWVDLLLITSYEGGFIKTKNGTIVKINRGECGFSKLTLSERWGWSRGKVTRFLSLLEREKMIQQKNSENTTIISIFNYDNFQNSTINDTINDTINGQQTNTIKKVKKDKNSNSSSSVVIEDENKNCFYGEYNNVYLTFEQYSKLKTMILNDVALNEIINALSNEIESGNKKYQKYSAEFPNAHFIHLKNFWKYRSYTGIKNTAKTTATNDTHLKTKGYNFGY